MKTELNRPMKVTFASSLAILALTLGSTVGVFAAPVLRSVRVGTQQPAPTTPGNHATYTVAVNRAGSGSMDVYLKIAGLPEGAVASFNPSIVRFSQNSPGTKTTTLTITTAATTPPGSYPLTIAARHGASPTVVRNNTTLVLEIPEIIATDPEVISVVGLPDGTTQVSGAAAPGQIIQIEATFSLTMPEWQTLTTMATDPYTGIFEFIDADAGLYPCRFYRVTGEQ